jgi:hypothetical protein
MAAAGRRYCPERSSFVSSFCYALGSPQEERQVFQGKRVSLEIPVAPPVLYDGNEILAGNVMPVVFCYKIDAIAICSVRLFNRWRSYPLTLISKPEIDALTNSIFEKISILVK